MRWHIALKFRIWLYFIVLQIKFKCCQLASIFVGVMPLLELKILEIHSFPQFSPTCVDILRWNFAYDFILLYYRSSLSVVNFRQFLYARLQTGRIMVWWCPSVRPSAHFLHFSHTCFDIMSWNFAHDFVLMYYRSSLSVVTLRQFLYARRDVLWYGDVRPSVRPSGSPSARFPHFSPTCFDILSWNFANDFVLLYYR